MPRGSPRSAALGPPRRQPGGDHPATAPARALNQKRARQACPRPEPPLPGVSPAWCPLCAALGPGHKPKKNQQKEEYIMENPEQEEKVTSKETGLLQRLLSLAAAAALALSLVGCGTSGCGAGRQCRRGAQPSSTAASVELRSRCTSSTWGRRCRRAASSYAVRRRQRGRRQPGGPAPRGWKSQSHATRGPYGRLAAALTSANHVYSPVTEASTKCFRDFIKYTQQQGLLGTGSACRGQTTWPPGQCCRDHAGPRGAVPSDTNDTLHRAAHRWFHQLSAHR